MEGYHIALIIIGGIIALIALVLFMRASLTIEYKDELRLYVSLMGIRFKLWPQKKKKHRLSDYTEKKIQKRREKKEKEKARKEAEKAKKEAKKPSSKEIKISKDDIIDKLDIILDLSKSIVKRFSNHLSIKLTRLRINVATSDAAATAILYGAVTQSVAYLIEFLDCVSNIKVRDININADFISEKTTIDIKITFGLRVWQVIDLSLHGLFRFLKNTKFK